MGDSIENPLILYQILKYHSTDKHNKTCYTLQAKTLYNSYKHSYK